MKRTLRMFLCLAVMSASVSAFAERLEVFRWQALDGKTEQLVSALTEAAKLHEKTGASVGIFQMDVGVPGNATFDYVLRWNASADWAKTKSYNASDEWLKFFSEATKNPSGQLMMSLEGLNWDAEVTASSFADDGPFRVFIWRPTPGMMSKIYETFMTAKGIHEKLGAKVNIYNEGVGGTGNIHYVMSWDDWGAMAKSGDAIAASKEFMALQMSAAGLVTPVASIQGVPVYYSK
ncbi:MAG: hypothetical protein P8O79_06935 [Halieaceae bacterium]|nr:hypothetical protein [Halieaceae bacterium]